MTAMPPAASMGRLPTIGVVIPLFNKAGFVEETLRSVLAQTRQPDEIIIVDDGSSDAGPDIVRRVGGLSAQLLRTPSPRSGPSAARNLGIAATACEWIALLDADDLWSPDYLAAINGAISSYPDAGCIFSSRTMALGHGSTQHPPVGSSRDPGELGLEDYLALWLATGQRGLSPIHSSACVIRKAVLKEAGLFPEGCNRGEDKDTWLRVMTKTRAVLLPEPLVRYRNDIPGQLNRTSPQFSAPPLLRTALALARQPGFNETVKRRLGQLASREAWLYSVRRRLRPLDKSALHAAAFRSGPLRYFMVRALYAAGLLTGRS